MSASVFSVLSLGFEIAIGLCVVLALCSLLNAGGRILTYRAAFAVAVLAPLTLAFGAEDRPALITVPLPALTANAPTATTLVSPMLVLDIVQAILPLVIGSWLVGALAVLAHLALAHLKLSRLHAAGWELADEHASLAEALRCRLGLDARVSIRFSEGISSPCVFGWARPRMLLPTSLSDQGLPAVLAHEFCHVRNGDTVWLVLARMACAVHWFNPLIWLCLRRHRDETELVCDDAAATTMSAGDYATALVEVARASLPSLSAGGVFMSERGLGERVRALMSRSAPLRLPSPFVKGSVIAGATAAIAIVGAVQIVSAADAIMAPGDPMAAISAAGKGNGLIFVDAPAQGRIDVDGIGACWDGSRCVFEDGLGRTVTLRARTGRRFEWLGCDQVSGNLCVVRISSAPAHVSLRVAS